MIHTFTAHADFDVGDLVSVRHGRAWPLNPEWCGFLACAFNPSTFPFREPALDGTIPGAACSTVRYGEPVRVQVFGEFTTADHGGS